VLDLGWGEPWGSHMTMRTAQCGMNTDQTFPEIFLVILDLAW
jgi:hypothetical protein